MRRRTLCMAAAGSMNQLRRNSIRVRVGRAASVADQFAHRGQQATWTVQRLPHLAQEPGGTLGRVANQGKLLDRRPSRRCMSNGLRALLCRERVAQDQQIDGWGYGDTIDRKSAVEGKGVDL